MIFNLGAGRRRNGYCPHRCLRPYRPGSEAIVNASETLEMTIGNSTINLSVDLLNKYNRPGPRYTSYPTAPEWNDSFGKGALWSRISRGQSQAEPCPALTLLSYSVLRVVMS